MRQAYSLVSFCAERNLTDSISEHNWVTCTDPIPRLGLAAGAAGVIIHTHGQGLAYEVEFMREDGTTIGVETIALAKLTPFRQNLPATRLITAI